MEERVKKDFKIAIANAESEHFAGAYLSGSIKDEEGIIFLNLKMLAEEANNTKEYIDSIHETLVHEFCHLTQDLLDKEMSELETDEILKKIKPSWGERDEDPVTSIYDLLDWVHKQEGDIKKEQIISLFRAVEDAYNEHKAIKEQ